MSQSQLSSILESFFKLNLLPYVGIHMMPNTNVLKRYETSTLDRYEEEFVMPLPKELCIDVGMPLDEDNLAMQLDMKLLKFIRLG
jgi:hypothetical protein